MTSHYLKLSEMVSFRLGSIFMTSHVNKPHRRTFSVVNVKIFCLYLFQKYTKFYTNILIFGEYFWLQASTALKNSFSKQIVMCQNLKQNIFIKFGLFSAKKIFFDIYTFENCVNLIKILQTGHKFVKILTLRKDYETMETLGQMTDI